MKKHISIAAFLLFSFSSIAQKEPMLGKWSEVKFTFIDTTDAGRDLVMLNYEAYRNGEKILDPKFIAIQEGFNENLILTFTTEKEKYWAKDESGLKHEISFDKHVQKYFITLRENRFEVKYDGKTKSLYLINPLLNNTFYEFKRKI